MFISSNIRPDVDRRPASVLKPVKNIAGFARKAVAGQAHSPENERRGSPSWETKAASHPASKSPVNPQKTQLNWPVFLDVQQILAGKLRLVGNEGKARLGLGAHQPL